jgi:hypothetical protein
MKGRTDVEKGKVLGHENLGGVIEVGNAADRVKVRDWMCLPFNIAYGFCKNCERGFTGFCLTVNPGFAGGAYGYASMGPYRGGQAFVWASVYAAPVVFLCQNNQWGISTPTANQSRVPLYQRARGFGFPGVRVDGNDVLATYAVTVAALRAARAGQGPVVRGISCRRGQIAVRRR